MTVATVLCLAVAGCGEKTEPDPDSTPPAPALETSTNPIPEGADIDEADPQAARVIATPTPMRSLWR